MANISGTNKGDTITTGAADDTVWASGGNDSVTLGDGNDEGGGGSGDDTIRGQGGNDKVWGDDGNDQLYGDSGNDTVGGGAGKDTLDGGTGDDHMGGGDGRDLIYGRDGNDAIGGDADNDTIYAGDGNDSVGGGADDDLICGEGGDDRIGGDGGNDTISGGAGHDGMDGGTGEDVLYGDDGNDSMGGNDVLYGGIGDDDLSGNAGNDTLDGGDGPICLCADMPVDTPDGAVPVEMLRAGDLVLTRDGPPMPVRLNLRETHKFRVRDDRGRPILIAQGALGDDLPQQPLGLSPRHRVLMTDATGGDEYLVPAVKLVVRPGIRRMRGVSQARYYNILMDRHAILETVGLGIESLLVTTRSLLRLPPDIQRQWMDRPRMGAVRQIRRDPSGLSGAPLRPSPRPMSAEVRCADLLADTVATPPVP